MYDGVCCIVKLFSYLHYCCCDTQDNNIVKVVLVTSDRDTVQLLRSNSSDASRMDCFRLGDLRDDEIVPFMKFILPVELHNRLESEEVKNVIAEVTGGSIKLLLKLARAIDLNCVSGE